MIELCVFNIDDDFDLTYPDSMISIQNYMLNKPDWTATLENTIVIFEALSEEQNMEINKFGLLDFILPQLKEIRIQMNSGSDALLRTAGDYGSRFFLFEMQNSDVTFSILGDFPAPLNSYYPLTDSPVHTVKDINQKEELYTYLLEHKEHLKSPENCSLLAKTIKNIPMKYDEISESLEQQIIWGEKLLNKTYLTE